MSKTTDAPTSYIERSAQILHSLCNDAILSQTNHLGISMYKCSLIPYVFYMFVGCAKQPTPTVPSTPESTPTVSESNDCPEGVKTGCNVPDVTQSDLDANQQKIQTCTEECIQSRQAESISAEQIQNECHNKCMEEHFMGQVEVIPEILLDPAE